MGLSVFFASCTFRQSDALERFVAMPVDETRYESRAFEADVAKLLNLIVLSVYSDRTSLSVN